MNKSNYREVYLILNKLGDEYIKRIPANIYKYIVENMDTQTIKDQKISKESISFIAALHYKYWLQDEKEKIEFLNLLNENQKKKNEQNNVENLFKKEKSNVQINQTETCNKLIKPEKWYEKVIGFFKKIFRIGENK